VTDAAPEALPFNRLLRLGYDTSEEDQEASKEYDAALEAFRMANGGQEGRVAIFRRSGLGVYLTRTALRSAVLRRALKFDSTAGLRLLHQLDAVAEQARDWWKEDDPERKAVLQRCYSVSTGILAAVDLENRRHLKHGDDEESEPSERHLNDLNELVPEVNRVREFLYNAAQRKTQERYGRGMLLGALGIAALCAVLGWLFSSHDTPAEYGVALPCGAAGALVSVLQRMTSGRLRLDVHAGPKMTLAYGALRPAIGGVFGMALFVLLEGGLLPAVEIRDGAALAFYAGIGFLAGFNERWAQDMLAGSSKSLPT
jgi:hypothetical protein